MFSGILSIFAYSIVFDSCFVYRKSTLEQKVRMWFSISGWIGLDYSFKLVFWLDVIELLLHCVRVFWPKVVGALDILSSM